VRTSWKWYALAAGALALAACGGQAQPEAELSTSQAETAQLVASMKQHPQIAAGQVRSGPDTHLLPAPTFPDPSAHAGHAGMSHHPQQISRR
jgi:hypothetical protein